MDIIIFLFVVAIALGLIMGFCSGKKKEGLEKSMETKLNDLDEFFPNQNVAGDDGESGIAIDEDTEKVCLIKRTQDDIELDVLSYRDILSSEIFEDGETVTKTARGSQFAGALIGGLALGGVGAVIGGLSGKTISSGKVSRIDLRIIVNRIKKPMSRH